MKKLFSILLLVFMLSSVFVSCYNKIPDDGTISKDNPEFLRVPVFLPTAGNVPLNTKVKISCATDDATIYYTVGSDSNPKDESQRQEYDPTTRSFIIDGDLTLKAVSIKDGVVSDVIEASYTVDSTIDLSTYVFDPVFVPGSSKIGIRYTKIKIMSPTEGAKIYYTTNGMDPNDYSRLYNSSDEGIPISRKYMTIKAVCMKGGVTSNIVTSRYEYIKQWDDLETDPGEYLKDGKGIIRIKLTYPDGHMMGSDTIWNAIFNKDGKEVNVKFEEKDNNVLYGPKYPYDFPCCEEDGGLFDSYYLINDDRFYLARLDPGTYSIGIVFSNSYFAKGGLFCKNGDELSKLNHLVIKEGDILTFVITASSYSELDVKVNINGDEILNNNSDFMFHLFPKPEIEVSIGDIPNTFVNNSTDFNIFVKNVCSRDIYRCYRSISSRHDHFVLVDPGQYGRVIEKGSTQVLKARFTPTSLGELSGELSIRYDGKEAEKFTLKGNGVTGKLNVLQGDKEIPISGNRGNSHMLTLEYPTSETISEDIVFKNTGDYDIELTFISLDKKIETGTNELSLNGTNGGLDIETENLTDQGTITVQPDEEIKSKLLFNPTDVGFYNTTLKLKIKNDVNIDQDEDFILVFNGYLSSSFSSSPKLSVKLHPNTYISNGDEIDFGTSHTYRKEELAEQINFVESSRKICVENLGDEDLIGKIYIKDRLTDSEGNIIDEDCPFGKFKNMDFSISKCSSECITLEYLPLSGGQTQDQLIIETNDPETSTFIVTLKGEALSSPEIILSNEDGKVFEYNEIYDYDPKHYNANNESYYYSNIFVQNKSNVDKGVKIYIDGDPTSTNNYDILLPSGEIMTNDETFTMASGSSRYFSFIRKDTLVDDSVKLVVRFDGIDHEINFKGNADELVFPINDSPGELEKIIRTSWGFGQGDIYSLELKRLSFLYLGQKYTCSDLDNIRYLTGLTELEILSNDNLKTLDALAPLTNLRILCLNGCKNISNFDSLSSLNVRRLEIVNIGEDDLSFVNNIKSLEVLRANQNNVSEIPFLLEGNSLTEIRLERNNITNVSPLVGCRNLRTLSLGGNKIKSIRPLKNLLNLEKLSLSYNEISNIKDLSGLINIKSLDLSYNEITDLSPLLELDKIKLILIGGMSSYLFPDDNTTVSDKNNEVIRTLESRGVRVRKD